MPPRPVTGSRLLPQYAPALTPKRSDTLRPMSWLLPLPLLLFASTAGLVPLMVLRRGEGKATLSRPDSGLRAKAAVTRAAGIAPFWRAWVARWLVEQRW